MLRTSRWKFFSSSLYGKSREWNKIKARRSFKALKAKFAFLHFSEPFECVGNYFSWAFIPWARSGAVFGRNLCALWTTVVIHDPKICQKNVWWGIKWNHCLYESLFFPENEPEKTVFFLSKLNVGGKRYRNSLIGEKKCERVMRIWEKEKHVHVVHIFMQHSLCDNFKHESKLMDLGFACFCDFPFFL